MAEKWKERLEAYRLVGAPAKFNEDEAIVRQIMKGLGWDARHTEFLATVLGAKPGEGQNRMATAEAILDIVSGGMFGPMSPSREFIISTQRVPLTDSGLRGRTVEQLVEMAKAQPGGVIAFNRTPKDRNKAIALVFMKDFGWHNNVPDWLLRPGSLIKWRSSDESVTLWIRGAADLVRDMAGCLKWDIPDQNQYEWKDNT